MQPRDFNPKKTFFLASLIIAFAIFTMMRTTDQAEKTVLRGQTMGTTWQAVISANLSENEIKALKSELLTLFDEIDKQMSGWNTNSVVMIFNARPANHPIQVDDHFIEVLSYSLDLAEQTSGGFDVTIKPLLDTWGFGAGTKKRSTPPAPSEIASALANIGYSKVILDTENKTIAKTSDAIHLEVNATAKGYAVEQAASLLVKTGFTNCLFEIGGEFAARGTNPSGRTWRLGISTPSLENSSGGSLQAAVNLEDAAMATSGDYQNYFSEGTNIFTHVIDPRTGSPVANGVASATVITSNCMHADGLATTMMVLGVKEGLELIENLSQTEAMLITRSGKNTYEHHFSSGFQALLKADP